MMIRVLLVEDDPLVAMMLEGYLDVLEHEIVATAATVAERWISSRSEISTSQYWMFTLPMAKRARRLLPR